MSEYWEYGDQAERTQRLGHCLIFDDDRIADEIGARFGGDGNTTECKVILIDRKTGIEYPASSPVPLEHEPTWDGKKTVMGYFMFWHYCGCHRLGSIACNEPDTDLDCPSNRFLVKSVRHPKYPDLNLYYETPLGEYTEERGGADNGGGLYSAATKH